MSRSPASTRLDPVAIGLLVGFAADRVLGDPRRGHPVAGFGRVAAAVEERGYAPRRVRGGLLAGGLVAAVAGTALLERRLPPTMRAVTAIVATWAVLGGRSLEREGEAIGTLLTEPDLSGARARIRNLVGRDPSRLDGDGIARACVESIAENSADAVVAPLFWGAVAGVPGLVGYRAVNTLDAMWGHRNARYERFGWAAARLDDLVNWLPARLTVALNAALAAVGVGSGGGADDGATGVTRAGHVLRTVLRDAPAHPSPNAGPVEASWASVLGVRLGGTNHYDGVDEDRGQLGDGPSVTPSDIPRATAHLRRLSTVALITLVAGRAAARHRRH